MSCSTIWESLKAYLRGKIISYTANQNKVCSQQLQDLNESIATLDEKYATDPSPTDPSSNLKLMSFLPGKLNSYSCELGTECMNKAIRPVKLLAHQIRKSLRYTPLNPLKTLC